MLKLMYITNDPQVAAIAQRAGVDRVFIDLETVGKELRQGGMNTVKSQHSISDIPKVKQVLTTSQLLVRVNPIYPGSEAEINAVVEAGAEIIMLPFFHTPDEVRKFLDFVGGRAKTMLLFETPAAVERIDEILALDGIDECFIGLNDLHLGYGRKFMFELLTDGTAEAICRKFAQANKPYGFGGIAKVGTGPLPAERIIGEHVRLGSTALILSRSFCNVAQMPSMEAIAQTFLTEVPKIRAQEQAFRAQDLQALAGPAHRGPDRRGVMT